MTARIGDTVYFHTMGRRAKGARTSGTCIKAIRAAQRLDSRGMPTIQTTVELWNGIIGRALVPSGASTGTKEALELRDGSEPKKRYIDAFVSKAIGNVHAQIAPWLVGMDVRDPIALDQAMIGLDGTECKSNLGANAILSVSMAATRAAASAYGLPLYRYLGGRKATILPVPMMNVLNAGAHAGWVAEFQEKMVALYGVSSFSEAVWRSAEFYQALKRVLVAELKEQQYVPTVGDEGGFAPPLATNEASLKAMMRAATAVNLRPGQDFFITMDPAASEFYRDGKYRLNSESRSFSSPEMISLLIEFAYHYPIVSIEDGLAENDLKGWSSLTRKAGVSLQLVGDDLFVTNPQIFKTLGIEGLRANSILIKLNQIGTVTETLEAIELARQHGYSAVISHRSGETEDTFIADLAVATGVGQIKTGAPARSERGAKYNRLLDIEEELGPEARYAGLTPLGEKRGYFSV